MFEGYPGWRPTILAIRLNPGHPDSKTPNPSLESNDRILERDSFDQAKQQNLFSSGRNGTMNPGYGLQPAMMFPALSRKAKHWNKSSRS